MFKHGKINLAKEFSEAHETIELAEPRLVQTVGGAPRMQTQKERLLEIYAELIGGTYGNAEPVGDGYCVIEIEGRYRKNGRPFLFVYDARTGYSY